VGGLSLDTREDDLRMYFRQFGEVAGCIIKYDSNSSISRGFGFVSFNDHEVLINVLSKNHIIKGKQVDCKEAMTKEEAFQLNLELLNSRKKIFVGKVPRNVTKSVLYQYFSRYGVVEDVNLIFKKPKEGFAFVVFADNDTAEKALMEKNHVINETQVQYLVKSSKKFSLNVNLHYQEKISHYNNKTNKICPKLAVPNKDKVVNTQEQNQNIIIRHSIICKKRVWTANPPGTISINQIILLKLEIPITINR